jgi:L-alanine-DL-glutamate epimerase-like enolase superfamily enzyme
MKIKRIEIIPVSIPLKKKVEISFALWEKVEYVVTKFYTDDGIVGLGESSPWVAISRDSQETVVGITSKHLAPLLINENPFSIEKIWWKMDTAVPGNGMAKAALDIPLYDIMGKALGVPVYQLLGGKTIDSFPLVGMVGLGSTEQMVRDAMDWLKAGYRGLRVKIGKGLKEDRETISELRKAIGPDVPIRVDANQAYTPSMAIRVIKTLEPYDIEMVEQPVVWHDFEGLARVTASVDTPIIPHESLYSVYDAIQLDRMGAGNVFAIKTYRPGGITLAKKLAAYLELRNVPMYVCSAKELAICTAAAGHLATAYYRNIKYACEMTGPAGLADDIAEPGVKIEKGMASVFDRPGYGVELDESRMKKYGDTPIVIKG